MAALVLLAGAVLVGTVVHDRSSASPLFPSDAFSPRTRVGVGLWIVFLMPLAQASTAVYLVLTLQTLWGLGATVAGAFNASLALAWSFTRHRRCQPQSPREPRDLHCLRTGPARCRPRDDRRRPRQRSCAWSRSPARSPSAPASVLPGPFSARPSWRTHAHGERDRASSVAADAAVGRLCRRRGLGRARRQRRRLYGR